tara:strand:+ start:4640 stop:4897 length:258 start_codon:yes stop_codon:yes gene_type:complete
MGRKNSGFTKAGIKWYKQRMAEMVLAGKSVAEAYELATEIDGMHIHSIRRQIPAKAIKAAAIKIAGTQTLEEYFEHKNELKSKAA